MSQAADGPRCQLLSGKILANVFGFLFVVLCVFVCLFVLLDLHRTSVAETKIFVNPGELLSVQAHRHASCKRVALPLPGCASIHRTVLPLGEVFCLCITAWNIPRSCLFPCMSAPEWEAGWW